MNRNWFKILESAMGLFSMVAQRETRVCRKCKAVEGTLFCDRSLFGEVGACEFVKVENCRKCGSAVPCYGLPCELCDRLAAIRTETEAQ